MPCDCEALLDITSVVLCRKFSKWTSGCSGFALMSFLLALVGECLMHASLFHVLLKSASRAMCACAGSAMLCVVILL